MEAVGHAGPGRPKRGSPAQPFRVLLVEDDAADVYLATEALAAGKIPMTIDVAGDGVEAFEKLSRASASGAPPDLILLDLNLPRMDGREVFRRLNASGDYSKIPVLVLTSSEAERDATECRNLGAKGYITKTLGPEAFRQAVEDLCRALAKPA